MNAMLLLLLLLTALLVPRTAFAGVLWRDVCTQDDTKDLAFCDTTKDLDTRVEDYVTRVSLEDKAKNMHNEAEGVPSLHIPPYQWGSEGLHGPLQPCVCTEDNSTCRCPTSFPCPSALGTAFNDSLYFMIGRADGREARAINNLRNHVTQNVYGDGIDYWSPTLNMQRDPRWGRNQEVPGEDPELTGNYAANFVQGLQGDVDGLDASHVQITACCKHFIANSLEDWEGHTRYDFDAHVPYDDLRNYYLPAFRSCVMEGRSNGVMCSYNAVTATQDNGKDPVFSNVPSCANDWLLQETLRDGWKFDGYVTSDCGAINNECQAEPQGHGVYNCTEATARSISAGTDVDCGPVYQSQIVDAVKSGLLDEKDVDRAFARLTKQQMMLGLFDSDKDTQPYFKLGIDDIDTAEHRTLAYEAAQQSIVLLQNKGGLLPLKKSGNKIAVVGPHVNATDLLLSNYHGSRCLDPNTKGPGSGNYFGCISTPLGAVTKKNGGVDVVGSLGCDVATNDTSKIAAAVQVAKDADVVILTMGVDQTQEREGLDRTITTLPGVQQQLITEVLSVQPNAVLVLFSGGAMSLGPIKSMVPSIVSANYGGEFGAEALADILFGDYNPSGKLAATMYPPSYVDDIPLTEMSVTKSPGRTHMFYEGVPEFAFGAGLSYTRWNLTSAENGEASSPLVLSRDAAALTMRVELTNVGPLAGRNTALMFWRPVRDNEEGRSHAVRHHNQKLVGYKGTHRILHAGESEVVAFEISLDDFSIHQDGVEGPRAGEYEIFVTVGGSEIPGSLRRRLTLVL